MLVFCYAFIKLCGEQNTRVAIFYYSLWRAILPQRDPITLESMWKHPRSCEDHGLWGNMKQYVIYIFERFKRFLNMYSRKKAEYLIEGIISSFCFIYLYIYKHNVTLGEYFLQETANCCGKVSEIIVYLLYILS